MIILKQEFDFTQSKYTDINIQKTFNNMQLGTTTNIHPT